MNMKTSHRRLRCSFLALVAFIAGGLSFTANAQSEEASRRRNFNVEHGVAMRGFDPVSYFNGRPLKGDSKYYHHHKGITYYFANEQNRDAFEQSPGKYEPVYGGWCAYTVASSGDRVKINPSTFKIVDGKLHLFYNFNGDNRLRRWNADEPKLKASGNRNWIAGMH